MARHFVVQFHPSKAVRDPAFLARFDRQGRDTAFVSPADDTAPANGLGYLSQPLSTQARALPAQSK
jgi:hypothetical protein